MSKLVQALLLGIVGLVALRAAGPAITQLVNALVPLVLVVGAVIGLWRLVDYFTRA